MIENISFLSISETFADDGSCSGKGGRGGSITSVIGGDHFSQRSIESNVGCRGGRLAFEMKPGEEKSKVVELTLRCSRDDPRRILVESLGKVVETQYESLVELFGIRWEEKRVEEKKRMENKMKHVWLRTEIEVGSRIIDHSNQAC
ncbi:hypothetical protein Tco_1280216 [Tanacetum coccineum]